jgi:uncharacterized phage protein gp47/JayE
MPFQRPTLPELISRIDGDIRNALAIVAIIRRSFLGAISRALAGASHLLLGYLDWISRQVFPDTAEGDSLIRWARLFGLELRPATFAELNIEILGTSGSVVPQGEIYQSSTGLQYVLDAEVTIGGGGSAIGKVIASLSGTAYNLEVGANISLLSPISGIVSQATVDSIEILASDTEDIESLRARLINRLQLPPLGGSANDYIQWALEVGGVTRAWVLPLYTGPGTVGVSFVDDTLDPIIPDTPKIQEVQDYIEERKPVTALVTVFAPVPLPLDIAVDIQPNNSEVQTNIINELSDLVRRDATLAGSYKGPSETNTGAILLSRINQAISIAVGLEDFEIDTINGDPPANVVPASGELIVLGNITFGTLT